MTANERETIQAMEMNRPDKRRRIFIDNCQAEWLLGGRDAMLAARKSGESILLDTGAKLTWHAEYGWIVTGYAPDGSDIQESVRKVTLP